MVEETIDVITFSVALASGADARQQAALAFVGDSLNQAATSANLGSLSLITSDSYTKHDSAGVDFLALLALQLGADSSGVAKIRLNVNPLTKTGIAKISLELGQVIPANEKGKYNRTFGELLFLKLISTESRTAFQLAFDNTLVLPYRIFGVQMAQQVKNGSAPARAPAPTLAK